MDRGCVERATKAGARVVIVLLFFFFNDTATTELYTLSLHDALPILWPCPLATGQVTVTVPSPFSAAVTATGGSGTSEVGTTGLAASLGPAPLPLTAYTVNRYCWPLVSSGTSKERWSAPTLWTLPSPSMTYMRMSEPLGAAGPQVIRACALPAEAVTLVGAPGGPTAGFVGGGGGGLGGGSAPSTLLAYLSTTLTRWRSSTTRAPEELGALMNRWFSRTSSSSGPPAFGMVMVLASLPAESRT